MTISIRHAPATSKNPGLEEVPAKDGESNLDWLKRATAGADAAGSVILLGGSDLAHFRIRCAQSRLRADMLPSFWSLAGIVANDRSFVSVPLDLGDVSAVPQTNAVRRCQLRDYADPKWFPNVAVVNFTDTPRPVTNNVARVEMQRSVIDLPSHVLPWLAYVWGTGAGENPLVAGFGLPSAAFVETVFGLAGIELTPGLSSASSCPEAIWSTASWWQDFYEARAEAESRADAAAPIPSAEEVRAAGEAKGAGKASRKKSPGKASAAADATADPRRARARVPTGVYTVRQPAAYVEE
ncbi:MAG TPA: hypothetical protein VN228_20360 [Pyrinomonadaceae bacterium]|nr:hypothetical protein [Pyrinomonadaceae bacterium]